MDDSDNFFFVMVLVKGLRVILVFVFGYVEMILSEFVDVMGLNKSIIQCVVFMLEVFGYLVKDLYSKWLCLMFVLLQVGVGYLQVGELIECVNFYLYELNCDMGESCNLLELVDYLMVYVVCFVSYKQILIYILLGQCLLIYCIVVGWVFLLVLFKVEVVVLLVGLVCIVMI